MSLPHVTPDIGTGDSLAAKRTAFTAMELLVVICALLLLGALLLPSLNQVRMFSKRTQCVTNLHNVGAAAQYYQQDFGPVVPVCWANIAPTAMHPWKSWRASLLPLTPGYGTFNCPGATDYGASGEVFHSAAEVWGQGLYHTTNAGSYGVIFQSSLPTFKTLNYDGDVTTGHPVWSQAFSTEPGAAWRDPVNSIYIADSCLTRGPVTYPSQSYKGYGTSGIIPPSLDGGSQYFSTSIARRFADRHGGTNCLFLDGRVVTYATSELERMSAGAPNCIWDVE